MKLLDLTCSEAISEPGGPTSTAWFRQASGFDLEFRDGLVYIRKGSATRIVPLANVRSMTPDTASAPAPAQPTKTR